MHRPLNHASITEESRLLYTLVDAADDGGLISDPNLRERAAETKERTESFGLEEEALTMFDLVEELDRSGALTGSWIQPRWRALKGRVEAHLTVPTRHAVTAVAQDRV